MNTQAINVYSETQYEKIDQINSRVRENPMLMIAKLMSDKASELERKVISATSFELDAKWGILSVQAYAPSYDEVFDGHETDTIHIGWYQPSEWIRVHKELEFDPAVLVKAPKDEVKKFIIDELGYLSNLFGEALCKAAEELGNVEFGNNIPEELRVDAELKLF